MPFNKRLVILGFGAMGSTLAHGWITKKLVKAPDVWAVDMDEMKLSAAKRKYKVKIGPAKEALPKASLVLLSVKPQQMKTLLADVGSWIPSRALVVSIAAGVSTSQIERFLPQGCPVVRVMPNTPSQLGAGMAVVAGGVRAKASHVKTALQLFGAVGRAVELQEELMDLVTGICGSGPAYLYIFLEALAEAGVKGGMSPRTALELAAQTTLGAARMVLETGKSLEDLRDQVSSPGGTTLAGLKVMEERGFKDIVRSTVEAATARAAELRKVNE